MLLEKENNKQTKMKLALIKKRIHKEIQNATNDLDIVPRLMADIIKKQMINDRIANTDVVALCAIVLALKNLHFLKPGEGNADLTF